MGHGNGVNVRVNRLYM